YLHLKSICLIHTFSLHDALPICKKELETRLDTLFTTSSQVDGEEASGDITGLIGQYAHGNEPSHHMAYLYNWTDAPWKGQERLEDRKSTRLNSSHVSTSYAVFCL